MTAVGGMIAHNCATRCSNVGGNDVWSIEEALSGLFDSDNQLCSSSRVFAGTIVCTMQAIPAFWDKLVVLASPSFSRVTQLRTGKVCVEMTRR